MTQDKILNNDGDNAGVIYHRSKWVKITLLSLAVLCLILAVCTVNVPLEFDLLFGQSFSYFAGFAGLCLIMVLAFAFSFGEQREGKVYLNKEGKLDISTPRSYEALKKPAFLRAISRSQLLKGEGLKAFEYKDGEVSVVTTKGNSISAPLSQLTWKYSMTKPNNAYEWYIYKYSLTDLAGNSVTYYRNNATFDEKEWDDMNMLLSLSANVDEGKISKLTKKMTKLLEAVDGFDFTDVLGSTIDLATAQVFNGTNKVIDMVRIKLYGRNQKKRSKFRETLSKIKNWIIMGGIVIYVLAIIVINIIHLIDYFSASRSNSDIENVEALYDESDATGEYDSESEAYEDAETAVPVHVPIDIESPNAFGGYQHEFHGKINNKYAVNMHLDLENYTGRYCYISSSGGYLDLEIVSYDPSSRAIQIVETNDSGELTGFFDGYLTLNGILQGTFTNYKGVEMPFRLEVQDAP